MPVAVFFFELLSRFRLLVGDLTLSFSSFFSFSRSFSLSFSSFFSLSLSRFLLSRVLLGGLRMNLKKLAHSFFLLESLLFFLSLSSVLFMILLVKRRSGAKRLALFVDEKVC